MVRKLALSAGTLVTTLLVAELFCRVTGLRVHDLNHEKRKSVQLQVLDERGDYFTYPADSTAFLWGSSWTFNSLGMRDAEPPGRSGEPRILVLGDSVTVGEGVPQPDIYPYRLRNLLSGDGVEVIAAGVSGWNTLEEWRFLEANVERLDPDLLLLMYVSNDNEPVDAIRRVVARTLTTKDRAIQALTTHSRIFEWAAFTWVKIVGPDAMSMRGLREWIANVKAAGEPFAPTDPGWQASREALLRMRDLMAERNGAMVVFLYDLGVLPAEPKALAALQAFGRENAVRVFDTHGFFAGHDWKSIVNDPELDPHPNTHGHAMLAQGIARTLREQKLIEAPD
jgi:lysophospholipase L1-like esterase